MKNSLSTKFFLCSALALGGCASMERYSTVDVDPNDCLNIITYTEYKGEGDDRTISKQHSQKTGVMAPNCTPRYQVAHELEKLAILANSGDALANRALVRGLFHESELVRDLTLKAMEEHDVPAQEEEKSCSEFASTEGGKLTFSCKIK